MFFGVLFSISVAACGGGGGSSSETSAGVSAPLRMDGPDAASGSGASARIAAPIEVASTTSTVGSTEGSGDRDARPAIEAPPDTHPPMLPLQLIAPPTARAGTPLVGVSVSLVNPGSDAPNARLRLIVHDKDYRHAGSHRELSPDNVKVEVQEGGTWKPVTLGMVGGGVMGAIGTEGVAAHQERHRRGGFAIPARLNKTWQLRVTFALPGTYSLVSAVSPDNGSRHLAQPAHSIIEVQ